MSLLHMESPRTAR